MRKSYNGNQHDTSKPQGIFTNVHV